MTAGTTETPEATAPARVVVQRRVEWPDTDITGYYHHSTVIRWVEAAEYVLHARLGLHELGLHPRVHYQASYRRRLEQNDVVDVHLNVRAVGRSSVSYTFDVKRAGELTVDGELVVVHIGEHGRSEPWPAPYRRAFLCGGRQIPELLSVPIPRRDSDAWGIGYG